MTDLDLPAVALTLARHFEAGGRLVATAPGRQDHANHVAVEFIHPAVAGARPLPATAVPAESLESHVRRSDAILLIEPPAGPVPDLPQAALTIRIPGELDEPSIVRSYHVLWELVQVGLEHPGLTGGSASAGGDSTGFLYPFLDAAETDVDALLESMADSAGSKRETSRSTAGESVRANEAVIERAVVEINQRVAGGGRVYSLGNGGSACDAMQLARLLRGEGVAAECLAQDSAILTALANDVGAANIFRRQLEAVLTEGDVLVVLSTSGSSENLLKALDVPTAERALVLASAGYGGGSLAGHPNVDHALVVDSASVHRIQEAQGTLIMELCSRIGSRRTA